MNLSDWRKAATLAIQHKQAATMADTDQLSSMPLSQIAGRFLSADYPRYPSGFIIPYFIIH